MREIMFLIPDQKYQYFMSIIEKSGFLEFQQEQLPIPKDHQEEMMNRVANSAEEDYDDWEDIKDSIIPDA